MAVACVQIVTPLDVYLNGPSAPDITAILRSLLRE